MAADETKKPDIIHQINENIMEFKYNHDMNTVPGVHRRLNPVYIRIQQAVHFLHRMNTKARRAKIREQHIQDYLRESKELEEVELGYTNTQP